jgi:hypothetical protein
MIGDQVRIHCPGCWYHGRIGTIVERSIYGFRVDIDQPHAWCERVCWFTAGQVYSIAGALKR